MKHHLMVVGWRLTPDGAVCERLAGQPLPARVITRLGDCNRRLFAGQFALLADHVLTLCHALESTLHRQSCPTHFRPAHRPRRGLAPAAGAPRHRQRPSSRRLEFPRRAVHDLEHDLQQRDQALAVGMWKAEVAG